MSTLGEFQFTIGKCILTTVDIAEHDAGGSCTKPECGQKVNRMGLLCYTEVGFACADK